MIQSLYEVEICSEDYDERSAVHLYAYDEEEAKQKVRDNPKFFDCEVISAYAVEE